MRQHLWPVVMLACLSLAGCSPPRSALIGTWRADLKMGTNLLTLNGDGTFSQEVKVRDATGTERTVSRAGTWEYDETRFGRVLLRNCLVPTEATGELIPRFEGNSGNCLYPVEREWVVSSRLRIGSVEEIPFYRVH